ncbi:hypothetical protein QCA50_007697 [Cerrena zonata]|uniref:F-box domain-containing protein n=1 Tax=Cerrena zonata TaxID=2478898 RepID=A0AAW0G8F2_9APHY
MSLHQIHQHHDSTRGSSMQALNNLASTYLSLLDESSSPNEESKRLEQFSDECNTAYRNLCFTINARKKINRLPLNILGQIFHSVLLPEPNAHTDFKSLISVTQVCRFWREFTSDNSHVTIKQLWASCWIDPLRLHPELLKVILQRSGDALLSVCLDLHNSHRELVDWCSLNISRMRALTLQSRNPSDFTWLPNADGKHLEALYLNYYPHPPRHDENPLPQLCNGNTPKLRNLWMNGIRLPWETKKYHNLTSLRICVPYQSLNGDQEFLDVFRDSPNLQDFSISCKVDERLFVRSSEDQLSKVLQTDRNPLPLRKLRRLHICLYLPDVQYMMRQISTPKTTKVEIQVLTSLTVIKNRDRNIFPDDRRCLLAFLMVKTLIVNAEKRSMRGWVLRWGAESREGIDLPLIDITIVPATCNNPEEDSRAANVANGVFLDSVHCLFLKVLSPASLYHLVLRDSGHRLEGQNQITSLKPRIILPSLRQFVLLSHLRLEGCSLDFIDGIHQEGEHSAAPAWCLQTLVFTKMILPTESLRKLLQNMVWFGDAVSLSIPNCILSADSRRDALETADHLLKIRSSVPKSTLTAKWSQIVHIFDCCYSESDRSWKWQERQP